MIKYKIGDRIKVNRSVMTSMVGRVYTITDQDIMDLYLLKGYDVVLKVSNNWLNLQTSLVTDTTCNCKCNGTNLVI